MKTIQIRDVPDDVHRALRLRAAEEDVSLSDYLRTQLAALAGRPTIREVLDDIDRSGRGPTRQQIVEAVRADRDAH